MKNFNWIDTILYKNIAKCGLVIFVMCFVLSTTSLTVCAGQIAEQESFQVVQEMSTSDMIEDKSVDGEGEPEGSEIELEEGSDEIGSSECSHSEMEQDSDEVNGNGGEVELESSSGEGEPDDGNSEVEAEGGSSEVEPEEGSGEVAPEGGTSEVESEDGRGEVEPEDGSSGEVKPEGGSSEGESEDGSSEGEPEEGSSEGESEDGSGEGESEDGSGEGESEDGSSEGESEDGSSEGEPEDGSSEGEPEDGSSEGEPEDGSSEGESEDGSSEGESEDGSGEGEPEDGSGEGEPEDGSGEGEPEDGSGEVESEDGNEGGSEEDNGNSGDKQEEADEVAPLSLETDILLRTPEIWTTRTALEAECDALGLICSGTEIKGYVLAKIGEILEIPEGILEIGGLSGMPAVEVIFPASLREIYPQCFMSCPNLKKVSLREESELWWVGMSVFMSCPELETIDFLNTDFTTGPEGAARIRNFYGSCPKLKYVFFSKTAIEKIKEKGNSPFASNNQYSQFTLKADATVASEADLCAFWKSEIENFVLLGLELKNVPKAAVIFNGIEIDITNRLQKQNIADAYVGDQLNNLEQEELWTSCFSDSTAKTAVGIVRVDASGSAEEGLHYNNFTEFYKAALKEGNMDDLKPEVQNEIAGVFSNVLATLTTKTQDIPKTMGDLQISNVVV